MDHPLSILLIEDSASDASPLHRTLRAQWMDAEIEQVLNLPSFRAALEAREWDLVLADFSQEGLDGLAVLDLLRQLAPHLPCIVISAVVEEEFTQKLLRAGARDFILKDRLSRLVPAIQRELAQTRLRARALETVEELEDRFLAVSRAAMDGIIIMDPEGRISFMNPAAEQIFGYSAAEVLGCPLHDLLAPPDLEHRIHEGVKSFHQTGSGHAVGQVQELEGIRSDGQRIPIELSLSALHQKDGWHAVGILRDIRSRRALEAERTERIRFLQTLLETIPTPIFYKEVGGRYLGCNQAFANIVGVPPDRLLGRTVLEILPSEAGLELHQKDMELLANPGIQVYPIHQDFGQGQIRHAVVFKATFEDADGKVAGIIGSLLDVTVQQQTEEALRRSQELFALISDHVVDLVALVDRGGRRLYSSPSYFRVLGFTPAEMDAMTSLDLLHPEDLPRIEEALANLFRGKATHFLEYRLRCKNRTWKYFESHGTLVSDPGCGEPRAVLVARDITERKRQDDERKLIEVQLRQAQKLESIGQLAAGIAHEINTPTQYIGDNIIFLRESFDELTTLLQDQRSFIAEEASKGSPSAQAFAQHMEDIDLDYLREEVPKAIQQSLEGVRRVGKIVGAMKDFSHPGTEVKERTDLNRAIDSTLTVSRNEWKYVADLEKNLDPSLPLVPCYPGEFNQVVLNLVVNAAHAIEAAVGGRDSGRKGIIQVTTRRIGDEVEILVADNGTGIPENIRERIFDPFFTTKPVGRGTGQGLAITRSVVVDKHGGRITLESKLGEGSAFRIFLPLDSSGLST